jgi:phosphocarrier protein
MKEIEVEIRNEAGLHARPSSLFVQVAGEYDANVTVVSDGEEVNGKSIMGLMLLAAEKGRTLKLIADGPEEGEILEALKKLIEVDKFNED